MINELNKAARKTVSYTIPTYYNYYLTLIERDTIYDISYLLYRLIITEYFLYIRDEIIESSREFKLPYRLGRLSIVKSKPKHFDGRSLRIDYQETKKLNKLVLLDNTHSNLYKYRAYWDKSSMLVSNKCKYLLIMTRSNKRNLAYIIKNNIHDYIEL